VHRTLHFHQIHDHATAPRRILVPALGVSGVACEPFRVSDTDITDRTGVDFALHVRIIREETNDVTDEQVHVFFSQKRIISSASAKVGAIGFSQMTCLPRSAAFMM
jgi:hypothetical protein